MDKFKDIKMNGEHLLSNSRANKKYTKNMYDIEFRHRDIDFMWQDKV